MTEGHLWMISRGSHLFDKLIVAVGTNPVKKYTFTVEERMQMIQRERDITHMIIGDAPVVEVAQFSNQLLINYAKSRDAGYLLRGIRSVKDYEFEKETRHFNSDIDYNIDTVFLMPPRDIAEISSSAIKGLVGFEGWEKVAGKYVPENVLLKLKEKHERGEL